MKKLYCWLLAIALSLVAVACSPPQAKGFAISLLARDIPPAQLVRSDLRGVELQPAPLLTAADLVSYSRASHVMELTPDAYARVRAIFPMPVRVEGIPFVVTVDGEPIYAGAFWTPASSLSFDGPFIMQPFSEDQRLIRIELGYPSNVAFTASDPRSDARVMRALEAAGKLQP